MHRHSNNPERVYNFIAGQIAVNGEAPTIAEIGREFELRSSASVHQILVKLEGQGRIKRSRRHRGIEIVRKQPTPTVGWLDR